MSEEKQKQHVSIGICGHVDSGKSTTTGRLMFELGGINERQMQKLRDEAKALGKDSFSFAFFMDRSKEERARGITIQTTTSEFYTDSYHYTILDNPGHVDYIKNMITGSSQTDVAVLMIPADGNFIVSLQKGDRKNNEVQGQSRHHARILSLLGVKQLIVCVNKMDNKVADYRQDRFDEVKNEIKDVLVKVGWKKDFVESSVPIIPISGWMGDNLIKPTQNMPWWNGVEVKSLDGSLVNVVTVLDALEKFVKIPPRKTDVPMLMPVSGCYSIKGVGDVITGRLEQGTVKPNDEVVFYPTNTTSNPCTGKVFTIEMHHKSYPQAGPGDNVGLNVKGLPKDKNMKPKPGDVMVLKSNHETKTCKKFTAQVQILEHPGELKVGYTPVGFIRTAHAPIRMAKLNWKMGKETGGKKLEDPALVKANELAEIVFEPQKPIVVTTFEHCEGLGRVAVLEGNQVVMIGRVTAVEY